MTESAVQPTDQPTGQPEGRATGGAAGVGKVAGPPMVYVPVDLNEAGEVENVRMVGLEDGRVALLGYTALDRFVHCCGEEQPWMLLDTEKLEELRGIKHFDVNYLDVPLPEHLRSTASGAAS